MSERKVISKYIPQERTHLPQSLLSSNTRKRKKNNQTKVRMMAPMTIRCTSCGAYAFQGTKFNSRKEVVHGEKYLGISILRFYQRCKVCGSEFTIKTDPKNEAYVAELGCVASYEPWKEIREKNMVMAFDELAQDEEGTQMDAVKVLEQRVTERKKELEMLDRLDELKTLKDERHKINVDELLENHAKKIEEEEKEKKLEEEFSEEQIKKLEQIKASENSILKSNTKNVHSELFEEISRKRKENNNLLDEFEFTTEMPPTKRRKIDEEIDKPLKSNNLISNERNLENSTNNQEETNLELLFGYSSD